MPTKNGSDETIKALFEFVTLDCGFNGWWIDKGLIFEFQVCSNNTDFDAVVRVVPDWKDILYIVNICSLENVQFHFKDNEGFIDFLIQMLQRIPRSNHLHYTVSDDSNHLLLIYPVQEDTIPEHINAFPGVYSAILQWMRNIPPSLGSILN